MNELILHEPLKSLWRDKDAFAEARQLAGVEVRHKEGRQTIRCTLAGEVFYRKFHAGVGWGEIVKNYLQLRAPVVDASNEWLAINLLHRIGVKTLTAVGYGRRGGNPASRQSFLITRELTGALSTAEFTKNWPTEPPNYRLRVAMIRKIAQIASAIHSNGMNHRDLYLCHFLLDLPASGEPDPATVDFYLVDLHRAQLRSAVPERWRVKDLASIYFSALDIGLTPRDVLRFMRAYYGKPLHQLFAEKQSHFSRIKAKARKLYRRDFKREPVFPL